MDYDFEVFSLLLDKILVVLYTFFVELELGLVRSEPLRQGYRTRG